MNQGRIWCVVSPNVGLPLLLGSVALTSLIVHASVLTHVAWFGNYWSGSAKTKLSESTTLNPATASVTGPAFSMKVTPVPAAGPDSPASFVITVNPTSTSTSIATASADPVVVPPGAAPAGTPPPHPATAN